MSDARTGQLLPARVEAAPVPALAVLCDIHANLPALEAVLADPRLKADALVVIGGDALSGPFPAATLARLEDLGERARFVRGNADRAMIDAFDGRMDPEGDATDRWAAGALDRAARDRVAAWPPALVVTVAELGAVRLCHATPRSDTDILTDVTPAHAAAAALRGVPEPVVACGHTHMAYDRMVRGWRVLNAGSVGMPYGEAGAHWLWLGPAPRLMRTPYDLGEAARRIASESAWPGAAAFARENVLTRPSRAQATAFFERLAGR